MIRCVEWIRDSLVRVMLSKIMNDLDGLPLCLQDRMVGIGAYSVFLHCC